VIGPPRPIHLPGKCLIKRHLTCRDQWGGAPSCWKIMLGCSSNTWGSRYSWIMS
jgi:hypothetical protein